MNRDKQIKKAVRALAKLNAEGITLERHCGGTCFKVLRDGEFDGWANLSVIDGEVYL